jgi:hypothetical protein
MRHAEAVSRSSIENVKEHVRQRAASLLLSDLATALYPTGSETDKAFWTGLGGDVTQNYFRSFQLALPSAALRSVSGACFGFDKAFERLMKLCSVASSPYEKLRYLLEIDTLLAPYMAERTAGQRHPRLDLLQSSKDDFVTQHPKWSAATDLKVEGFRTLFSNSRFRPGTVFRDLQYIASIVPSQMLGSTPEGKAFWNAVVAILGLKQEICRVMVETADSIIAYHSNSRGTARSSSIAQQERDSATFSVPSRTPSAEDMSNYKMAHAAELLQITAKEGDKVAQRELATLYLTNPELMDHIIAPLSRPRDVFKEELESKWRKNQDPNRCDPATMCVAHHWMSMSSNGGDALAKEYLRQREEMDRLG